jgi:hypothetical protein
MSILGQTCAEQISHLAHLIPLRDDEDSSQRAAFSKVPDARFHASRRSPRLSARRYRASPEVWFRRRPQMQSYASEISALPPRQIRPGISLGSVNAQLPENRSIDML